MITDDQSIFQISATDTYAVRSPVLRSGLPMESCRFEGDALTTTMHFGIFRNALLSGVVSLFSQSTPFFANPKQIQIRGMAVMPEYRNCGFGAALVRHAETIAKIQNADLIWFKARQTAVGFYEKMGYQKIGQPFNIGDIGMHFIMYKHL